jgi:hypothetical protein
MCLLVLLGLIGCKTQKKVVSESITSERTDTTKLVTDSIHKATTKQENRTTLTIYNDWGYIEFADSGGTLTIDGGLISAKGVKSYQHGKKAAQKKAESITQSKDSTDTHKLQANGMQSRDSKQANREPQKQGVKALKWYQRTIYHIGFLCCVAAIIYAIFLYLRRKK